jgi:hypothetical protein
MVEVLGNGVPGAVDQGSAPLLSGFEVAGIYRA